MYGQIEPPTSTVTDQVAWGPTEDEKAQWEKDEELSELIGQVKQELTREVEAASSQVAGTSDDAPRPELSGLAGVLHALAARANSRGARLTAAGVGSGPDLSSQPWSGCGAPNPEAQSSVAWHRGLSRHPAE